MATRNRRRTAWVGQAFDSQAISANSDTLIQVFTPSELQAHSEEPTILRTIFRLLHGGLPDEWAPFTIDTVFAFFLSPASADPITALFGSGLGDERIIASGYLSTAWHREEQELPGVLPLTIEVPVTRNQRGPWQMAEGDISAMRKIRADDSLMLQCSQSLSGTQPESIAVRGAVRVLLAL